jgi:hypothetical protein
MPIFPVSQIEFTALQIKFTVLQTVFPIPQTKFTAPQTAFPIPQIKFTAPQIQFAMPQILFPIPGRLIYAGFGRNPAGYGRLNGWGEWGRVRLFCKKMLLAKVKYTAFWGKKQII